MPATFLLDADIPPALADALQRLGHDARTAARDPVLSALSDAELLAEATHQGRILVTFNVVDFVALTQELAREDRRHSGVILIHARTFRRSDVGGMARSLDRLVRSGRTFDNSVIFLGRKTTDS